MNVRLGLLGVVVVLAGCVEVAPRPNRSKGQPKNAEASAPSAPAAKGAPKFIAASDGTAEATIQAAMVAAKQEQRTVVVYVGASWCEPCQYFHEAVEAGRLDEPLAGVTFVEFDSDRDGERLVAAGYDGRLIPRFALPGEDGRFGGTKIEGGIKGEGAVEHIMRRLGPMLATASR